MRRLNARRFREWFGFVAVVLALMSQLGQAFVALPSESPEAQLAALEAASIFCQSDHVPDGGRQPVPHRGMDYVLCPASGAFVLDAALLPTEPVVPMSNTQPESTPYVRPASRAPPWAVITAAYPRGPPTLV